MDATNDLATWQRMIDEWPEKLSYNRTGSINAVKFDLHICIIPENLRKKIKIEGYKRSRLRFIHWNLKNHRKYIPQKCQKMKN